MQNGRQYASRVIQETKKIREFTANLQTMQKLKDAGHKVHDNDSPTWIDSSPALLSSLLFISVAIDGS